MLHQITPAIPASPVAPPRKAVDDADSAVGDPASACRRRQLRPEQHIEAEQHEDRADRHAQDRRPGPTQQFSAERHTDDAADHKGQYPRPLQRGAQLPYRPALHDKSKGNDQRRRLDRWQRMQPDRGSDDAEGEPGDAGDESRGKGAAGK
jgi:hypothetical protein